MKKNVILCLTMIAITIVISFYIKQNMHSGEGPIVFSPEMTMKQVAEQNNLPMKEILHVLSHDDPSVWGIAGHQPIKNVMSDPETVRKAIEHIKEEEQAAQSKDSLKYILWSIYLSIILLVVFKRKHIKQIRIAVMVITILLFGVVLGATPNPMESLVKLFKLFNNMEGSAKVLISSFVLFTIFSLIGSKFICSWGCQLGAVQESLFNIPVDKRKYKAKIPFALSLASRVTIFIIFIVLLFGFGYGVVHEIKNFVVYHHINYFKGFAITELANIALYTFPLLIIASLFIYRPFCHFLCPFGLYSWILENIALNKIRIDRDKCIKCEKCVAVCPTKAMQDIYNGKRNYFLADCWSCGKCIDICPVDAIKYK